MGAVGHDCLRAQGNRCRVNAEDDDIKPATRLVEAGRRREWTQGIVNPPVWRASTVLYESIEQMHAVGSRDTHHTLYYGRRGTPTQWALADALNALEPGAEGTFLYCSGVAAIAAALLSVLKAGDELLLVDSAYEPSRAMARGLLKRFGITTRLYDPMIGAGIADLIGDKTRAIMMESPGSLTFEVQDVPAIVAAARARGIVTLLDNTWATPLYFPAIRNGVDLTILAATKYVVGHSDVMLGAATAGPGHFKALRDTSFQLGQVASPDDCWLGSRGLRTMGIRLAQHQQSALTVAKWLQSRREVAAVRHPAFSDCPGHNLFKRDFSGSSGLFSFVLKDADDAARAIFINALERFGIGYSWGGYESLAVPADPVRALSDPDPGGAFVRLHIGLEDPDDLIADLERGFAALESYRT